MMYTLLFYIFFLKLTKGKPNFIGNRIFSFGCNEFYRLGVKDLPFCLYIDELYYKNSIALENDDFLSPNKKVKYVFQTEDNSFVVTENEEIFGWGKDSIFLGVNIVSHSYIPLLIFNSTNSSSSSKTGVDRINDVYAYFLYDSKLSFRTESKKFYVLGEIKTSIETYQTYNVPTLISNDVEFGKFAANTIILSTDNYTLFVKGENDDSFLGDLPYYTYYSDFFEIDLTTCRSGSHKIKNLFIGTNIIVLFEDNEACVWGGYISQSSHYYEGANSRLKIPRLMDLYNSTLGTLPQGSDIIQVICADVCLLLGKYQGDHMRVYSFGPQWSPDIHFAVGRLTGSHHYPVEIEYGELNPLHDEPVMIATGVSYLCVRMVLTVSGALYVFGQSLAYQFGPDNGRVNASVSLKRILPMKSLHYIQPLTSHNHFTYSINDYKCYGVWNDKNEACSGSDCIAEDKCQCKEGFKGRICEIFSCNGIFKDDKKEICNGKGICSQVDKCLCIDGYFGDDCELFYCFGVVSSNELVCNSKGRCIDKDKCDCNSLLVYGNECENSFMEIQNIWLLVFIPISLLGVLILFVCLCTVFVVIKIRKQRKKISEFKEIEDIDILLAENEVSPKSRFAPFIEVNKHLFEIKVQDVRLLDVLGEGGGNAVVYKASWKNQIIAFKVFKLSDITGTRSQTDVKDFGKEISIMSSINSPYIVEFYGCVLKEPRIGMVYQYCTNGNLWNFIQMNSFNKVFEFKEKVRMMLEICYALQYLHERDIIHRDLKCDNCLVDDRKTIKITDFGLSRIIKSSKINTDLTKRVGSCKYMSPEMTLGKKYNSKIDVYSFGILIYELFTEKLAYFEISDTRKPIDICAASDSKFRPNVKIHKILLKHKWLIQLMENCWQNNYQKRKSVSEIITFVNENFNKQNSRVIDQLVIID